MGDQDALFIVAGFIVLMIGIASFSVQMTMRQNAKRREQLESDRASRSDQPSVAEKSRRAEALEEAIKREPSLANASSPGELARLDELVLSIQKEWQLKSELEAVQAAQRAKAAEEERSRALQQAAEEKRAADQERARLRKVEEERRKQEREQKIAAMSPVRRFATRFWIPLSVAAVVFIVMPAIGGVWLVIQAQQRDALFASCDWDNFDQVREYANWAGEWIQCEDPAIRSNVVEYAPTDFFTDARALEIFKDEAIQSAFAGRMLENPESFAPGALLQVIESLSLEAKVSLAGRPELPPDAQLVLAKDNHGEVRSALAGNPSLAAGAQLILVDDANRSVQEELLRNEAVDAETRAQVFPCSKGGICRIGDTGPGGGIVFHVVNSPQAWGSYLEAAPRGWSGSGEDPKSVWCPESLVNYRDFPSTSEFFWTIGTGGEASDLIIQTCGSNSAAALARSYVGGGFNDWYLPIDIELRYLSRLQGEDLGLQKGRYWSASGFWLRRPSIGIDEARVTSWDLRDGSEKTSSVNDRLRVRPIRAF